jgi:hypothetical protein
VRYARHAIFVSELAGPLLQLLDLRPGERILGSRAFDNAAIPGHEREIA